MQYEVILKWHQDDATGTYGLCHENAIDKFNAFWGADGVFHDVFEHYFEDQHKYFQDRSAFTIYGEMAASGHGIAYRKIGINNFQYRNKTWNSPNRDFIIDTTSQLTDWLYGYQDFLEFEVDKNLCRVPVQAKCNSHDLHYWLNEYMDWYDRHLDEGRIKIKQIPKTAIQRSYIWGYKQALKIIGTDIDHSHKVLQDFLDTWHRITEQNSNCSQLFIADEDAYAVNKFKFTVKTNPLQVTTVILDEVNNEWPLELLQIGE